MFDPNQQIYPDRLPQIVTVCGVPVRADLVFADGNGKDNARQQKAAEKALASLQNILPRLMGPNEVVLAVGFAQINITFFERMFLGWAAYYLGRSCLVVTNRGLLRFRMRSKGLSGLAWDNGVQGIGWGDVAEAQAKGGLAARLLVRFRNNQKESFLRLAPAFGKKVQTLAPLLLNANLGSASGAMGMTALCPKCLAPLATGVYRCAQCGQIFRDEKKLLWRTILIPGGEYFYARQAAFGILQAIVELVILVIALGMLVGGVAGGGDDPAAGIVGGIFIFLLYILHKWAAYIQCRRIVRTYLPAD